jgi:hypothetical protein
MGDLNARTKNMSDALSFDSDIIDLSYDFVQKQIDDEQMLAHFGINLNRVSQVLQSNNFGTRLINMCKSMGIMLANGRCGNDRLFGHTTCDNISIVDYVICSPELLCNSI